MTDQTRSIADISPGKAARVAGVLYLVITVAAIVAHMYVPTRLIVPGDAAATVANIASSGSLFRAAIGGEFVVLLSEIVLSVILYSLFRTVNRTISLTAAVSRLTMTAIHGINLLNYFFVLLLIGEPDYVAVFTKAQVDALVSLFLEAHSYGFTIGIAFLTIHVFALGYLIVKSGYVPRVLGVFFIVAGFGYLFDSFALLFLANYETTPVYFALPIALAEIAFPLWLLVKGVNVQAQAKGLSLASPQVEGSGV
ncbi:DUF4386 domain-containing protein [Litorilinea aerophila]|uniref:DUF4386 domain-containing protein n=1 Tax=Litorilinea aerophila TaxID=1204385 RepID=A0A540VCR6_9CHLR|nr:DUF4386 domain-containing protein [Litorilinea aerophila]MCC9077598.1 DUF4386 domain-containing protein [Litorilinea aerophila]GIV77359.1 MAG: DUF4386 domain-containing protein [Litorilinea sp.]